ncbi:MAG: nucleoside recognition domain-containing protein, partial [Planctomycetaceae bacterium]
AQLEALDEESQPDVGLQEALQDELNLRNAGLLEQSLLGQAGKVAEPVFRPLGWDWKIGVGVLASFPAREVIIASLGTIYSLGGDVDENDSGLRAAMSNAVHADGSPVFTIPTVLSLLVFFALCAQCVSTLVVIKRETQSWTWPVFSFCSMTALAWGAALITYRLASSL